jgi:nucleoid-associated protein YgaU
VAASSDLPAASTVIEDTAAKETTVLKSDTQPAMTAPAPQQQAAAATGEPAETAPMASDNPSLPRNGKVVIQPGNNLWRISRVIYGRGVEYTTIYDANKDQIRDPDLIYPGQIFATPGVVPPETIDPKAKTPLASTTDSPTSQE